MFGCLGAWEVELLACSGASMLLEDADFRGALREKY